MHSTLHLPASEAYKMVGLRDNRSSAQQPSAAPEPQRAPVRRTSRITVVRRVTGRTVA